MGGWKLFILIFLSICLARHYIRVTEFFLGTLIILPHCLLVSVLAVEKSAARLTVAPVGVAGLSSLSGYFFKCSRCL